MASCHHTTSAGVIAEITNMTIQQETIIMLLKKSLKKKSFCNGIIGSITKKYYPSSSILCTK